MFLSFHAVKMRHPTATVTAWENQMRRSIPSDCPCPWQCSLISSYIIRYHLIISDHIGRFWGWNWNHQKSLITSIICGKWWYMWFQAFEDLRISRRGLPRLHCDQRSNQDDALWQFLPPRLYLSAHKFRATLSLDEEMDRDGSKPGSEMIWNDVNQLGLETPSLSKLSIRSYLTDLWISMDLRYIREAFELIKIIKGYGSSKAMTSLHFTILFTIYQSISFIPRPDKFAMVLHLKRP